MNEDGGMADGVTTVWTGGRKDDTSVVASSSKKMGKFSRVRINGDLLRQLQEAFSHEAPDVDSSTHQESPPAGDIVVDEVCLESEATPLAGGTALAWMEDEGIAEVTSPTSSSSSTPSTENPEWDFCDGTKDNEPQIPSCEWRSPCSPSEGYIKNPSGVDGSDSAGDNSSLDIDVSLEIDQDEDEESTSSSSSISSDSGSGRSPDLLSEEGAIQAVTQCFSWLDHEIFSLEPLSTRAVVSSASSGDGDLPQHEDEEEDEDDDEEECECDDLECEGDEGWEIDEEFEFAPDVWETGGGGQLGLTAEDCDIGDEKQVTDSREFRRLSSPSATQHGLGNDEVERSEINTEDQKTSKGVRVSVIATEDTLSDDTRHSGFMGTGNEEFSDASSVTWACVTNATTTSSATQPTATGIALDIDRGSEESGESLTESDWSDADTCILREPNPLVDDDDSGNDATDSDVDESLLDERPFEYADEEEGEEEEGCGMRQKEDLYSAYGTGHSNLYEDLWEERPDEMYNNTYLATESPECDDNNDDDDDVDDDVSDADDITNDGKPRIFQAQGPYTNSPLRLRANKKYSAGGMAGTCLGCLVANDRNKRCYHRQTRIPSCAESRHYESLPCETVYSSEDSWLDSDNRRWYRIGTTVNNEETDFRMENGLRVDSRDVCNWESERLNIDTNECHDYIDNDTLGGRNAKLLQNNSSIIVSPFHADIEREKENATPNPCISVFVDDNYANCHEKMPPLDSIGRHSVPLESTVSEYQEDWHTPHGGEVNYDHYVNVSSPNEVCERCQEGYNFCNCGEKIVPLNHLKCPTNCRTGCWECSDGDLEAVNPDSDSDITCDGDDDYDALDVNIGVPENDGFHVLSATDAHPVTHHQNHNEMSSALAFDSLNFLPQYCSKRDHRQFRRKRKVSRRWESPPTNGGGRESWSFNAPPQDGFRRTWQTIDNKQSSYKVSRPLAEVVGLEEDSSELRQVSPLQLSPSSYATHDLTIDDIITTTTTSSYNTTTTTTASNATNITTITHTNAVRNNSAPCTSGGYQYATGNNTEILLRTPLCIGNNDGYHRSSNDFSVMEDIKTTENHENNEAFRYTRSVNFPGTVTGRWETDGGIKTTCKNDGASEERYVAQEGSILVGKLRRNMDDDGDSSSDNRELFGERKRQFERSQVLPECNRLHSNAAPVTRNDISNNNYLHSHDETGEFPGVAIGDEHHMTSGDYYADNYSGESYLNNGNSKSSNYFKPGRGGMVRAEEVVVGSRGVMVGSEVIGGFNALTTNLTAQSSASGVWSSGVTMEALENDRNKRLCAEHSLWPSGAVHSTTGCHLVDADGGRKRMGVATGCQQSSGINGSCSSLHGEQIIRDYRCERSKCDTDCQSHGRRSRQKFWTAVKPAYHANCNHCDSGSVVINSESTLLGKEVTIDSMEAGECDKWPSKKPSEVSLQRRLSIPAPCLSHSLCSRYPLYKKIQDILCFNHKPQTSNHIPSISPEELPSVVPPPPVLSQPKSVILEGDPLRGSSITHRNGESGVTACDSSRVAHPVNHYNCHITQQPEGEKSTMTCNPGSGRAHLKSTIRPSGKCNSRHWRSKVVGFAHREPPDGTATPAAPAVESKRTNYDDIRISEDLEPSREYKTSTFYAELVSDIKSPEKVASSDRLAGSITHLQNSKDSDTRYESASLVSEVQNGLSSTTDSSFVKESPTSSERKLTSSDLKPQTHVSLSTAQQSSVSPSPAVIGERSSRLSKTVIPEASSQQSSIFLAVDPATSSSTSTTAGHSSLVDLMKLSRYDGYITLPVTFAPCTPVESPDEIVAEPPATLDDDDASLSRPCRPCEGEDVGETRPPEGTDGRVSVSTQVRVSLRKYCRKRKNGTKKMVIKFTLCLECAGCKEELVEGQALIALDQQWHIWCFKCAACSTVLHGEYMGKDGLPYCEKDYQAQFGVKCAYCNRFISGKVLQAGENHHFHPTCARCTKCGDPFGDGEEMYLQGTAIWHPRCGPGPTENGTVLNGSLSNGHHVNGEQKAERERDFDGMSSTASETQFSGPYRTCSPGLILREYKSSQSPVDITRIYTYSYLTVEPSMGYLKRPLDPYDRPPPKSPHFHRPPTDSRKLSLPKTSSRLGMRVLVDQMQTETPRPKSPHMNNEEPIALSHYPGGRKPESGIISRIERDDFPAPPYPYTDPERRRRWSGSTKAVSIDETDEATEQEDSESIVDDPKLKREEQELSKIATGIGKVFLQQVKEREKIRAWKATHLDPRNASRSPAANREPGYKLRFESSLNASPSRMTDHTRPGYEDEEFDRGSSYRCSTGRSSATIPSYNVVSSLRQPPKPGYGFSPRNTFYRQGLGSYSALHGDYSFSGLGEKTQSTEFSSARSDVSAGSLTEADRSALNAELCASTTYSSGLRGYSSYSPHLRRSLPNMHHMSSEPPKIYPAHLLLVSNYRLPNDVDRCHLERHLSDTDFEMVFHMTRMDFYRLPEWRRNDLKRRAKLF